MLASGIYPKLADHTVHQLDLKDREARRLAQQSGHSHPIACQPAITVNGKRTGRVSG